MKSTLKAYPTPSLNESQKITASRIERLAARLKMPPSEVQFLMVRKGKIPNNWI